MGEHFPILYYTQWGSLGKNLFPGTMQLFFLVHLAFPPTAFLLIDNYHMFVKLLPLSLINLSLRFHMAEALLAHFIPARDHSPEAAEPVFPAWLLSPITQLSLFCQLNCWLHHPLLYSPIELLFLFFKYTCVNKVYKPCKPYRSHPFCSNISFHS